ncbi:CDP-glucose 4,6-dehydratase [Roseateles sp.]|uniref:CDP-glucose 4,6-dehydratase n=1 Tax=Roseateles sp. TaxID=1971397 RepID=UPI0025E27EF8|nr:CDP-glucose 4,6-dehydratase [Roseateles sp.]
MSQPLFAGVYEGRRVLVTGHTGFKGSWLALWLRQLDAQVCGLALPPATEPSHHALLNLGIEEAFVDLRDADGVRRTVQALAPDIVFHLAAQPLVRRSYAEPAGTLATNVMGLVHLFEAVRATPSVRAVVNVTTDKCYANRHQAQGYTEDDALGGHDPYSASKACAEIVSASYRASFLSNDDSRGHPVLLATARAGNVIGGGDWSEDRLIPDLVRAALAAEPARIRHPGSTRPWQHVLEPLAGYLLLGQQLLQGRGEQAQAWNFGPDEAGHLSVGEVVSGFSAHWPSLRHELGGQDATRHEAALLHLDCGKARARLGWRPVWDAPTSLARTARWYRAWHERGERLSQADLDAYVEDARRHGLAWAGQTSGWVPA